MGPAYAGLFVSIPYLTHESVVEGTPSVNTLTWDFPGINYAEPPKYKTWIYEWETCYPRAAVAYVRFNDKG